MKLENIDKALFKKRLNRFQGGLVAALLVLSLGLSQLYIALWGTGESNTLLNLAAVVTALFILAGVVRLIRQQPFMHEILYVRALKQELNRIYRASKKLEAALQEDKPEAVIVRWFQLHGSRHLYELEDNTLTMEELNAQIEELQARAERLGLEVSTDDYSPELIARL